jgi:hypothetical protein
LDATDSSPERSASTQIDAVGWTVVCAMLNRVVCLPVAMCRVDVARGTEPRLSAQLENIEAQLSLTSPSGLVPRMEALKAASRCDQQHQGRPVHVSGPAVLKCLRSCGNRLDCGALMARQLALGSAGATFCRLLAWYATEDRVVVVCV